ncbi:hypothetical protein [Bosea sp. NBC_00550]|uniref:hypothetical protein n=1 Tax=Bosea sp. NBC_00550 TaxID=2969621 RepID=UPI002230322A|nr:hypothetical protein [Bosea sp. NBC_00550]UZF93776.1 hypothetical protein NWE53_06165 [Bosea sp. NBC_00550]
MSAEITFLQGTDQRPRSKTYLWTDGVFVQTGDLRPGRMFTMRTQPVDGLRSLGEALRDAAPNEFAILGEPIDQTPGIPQRRLSSAAHGSRRTIRDVPRPMIILDRDTLPSLGPIDAAQFPVEDLHRHATADLPEVFRKADCLMFLSASFATAPGKVRVHLWFWLDSEIGAAHRTDWIKSLSAEAGRTIVDPSVAQIAQPIYIAAPMFIGAPDPVAKQGVGRWHFIRGAWRSIAVPSHASLNPGSGRWRQGDRAGGSSKAPSAWRDCLERMGGAAGYFLLTKSAVGHYVHQNGPDCDPAPFFSEYDRLIDERAEIERGQQYAELRKSDARTLFAWVVREERRKTRPENGVSARERRKKPTLAAAEAMLTRELEAIVDVAIARAFDQSILRAANAASADPKVDPRFLAGLRIPTETNVAEAGATALPIGLAVGKTEQALRQIARGVASGLRVAYFAPTHRLLAGVKDRLAVIAPDGKCEIWYGEAASVPADAAAGRPVGPACPRHLERAKLRLAGIGSGDILCGGPRRGYCPWHEKGNGPVRCRYRAQRRDVSQADVVLFSGGSLLGRAVPRHARGRRRAHIPLLDPETGELTGLVVAGGSEKGSMGLPPFDLVIIDEPAWLSLVHGLEEPLTEVSEGDVQWLGKQLASRTLPKAGTPLSDSEEFRRRHSAKDFLAFARALIGLPLGLVRYGDLETVLEKVRARLASKPMFAHLAIHTPASLKKAAWQLVIRVTIDPGEEQLEVIDRPELRDIVRWNRMMIALARAAGGIEAALRRGADAPPERQSGYLKVVLTDATEEAVEDATACRRRVQIRWIAELDPSWRGAPIVVLDATHRQRVAVHFLPKLAARRRIDPGPAPGSCQVRQVWDRSFSYHYLKRALDDGGGERLLRRLARWAEIGLALTRKDGKTPKGLLVGPKFLVERLENWWAAHGGRPDGLELIHFNALRGIDTWKDVSWLGTVSRPLPGAAPLRELAMIIDGQPPPGDANYVLLEAEWLDASNPARSWTMKEAVPGRTDPLEQDLLGMITDDELVQAVGRARLARRPGAGVRVDVLTSYPIPGLEVDELLTLEAIESGLDAFAQAAARGVAVDPGCKGAWTVLEHVTGESAAALKKAAARRSSNNAGEGDKSASTKTSPYEGSPFSSLGDVPVEPSFSEPPPGDPEMARGQRAPGEPSLYERLLAVGAWTAYRLKLPGERYAVRIWLRASTPMEAENIALRYFPAGFQLKRETPARRRGRPRKCGTAVVVWHGNSGCMVDGARQTS